METTEPGRSPHPRAVIRARAFLLLVAFACLAVAGGMWLGELASPAWWAAYVAAAVGVVFALSAFFEPSRSVVGTFLNFFFPWH